MARCLTQRQNLRTITAGKRAVLIGINASRARSETYARGTAFVIPAMIFFIAYYFALPVLIGYARPFMEKRVWGAVNLAYLFALSQFFMAWIIAALYVRAAAKFDRMARDVIENRK